MSEIVFKLNNEKYFQITSKTFAAIGVDPMGSNENVIITSPLSCYGQFLMMFLFVMALSHYSLQHISDINELTISVSLLNQLVIILWKILIYSLKRHRIQNILNDIRGLCVSVAKDDELEIVNKFYCKYFLASKFYYIAVSTTGICGLLRPVIIKLFLMLQGVNAPLELPHRVR